jgi:ADP-heptose:LPS heptosyltransferase
LKSILIIKPSSLGDIVHTIPAVALIRDEHPDAEITWVINSEFVSLLRGNPDVNHVYIFPRGEFRGLGAPKSLIPWLKRTRNLRPDLALDFQGLLRSALIAKIARAKQIYGMSDAREGSRWFYDRVAKVDRRAHAIERYIKLAELAGATVGPAAAGLRCPIPTGDPLPRFDQYPPFILLHPFVPRRVVVVGQSRQKIDTALENCVDLTNQTSLLQLIWLIRAAHFIVSVDSGPMHIAAALTDHLLSIHTWTDPRQVGPYNPNAWIWKNGQLCRVNKLGTTKIRKRGRRFRSRDVPALAELVRPLVPLDSMFA